MTVVLDSRSDLTLENYRRVALEGEDVVIGERAKVAMERARASFVALLESDRTAFMYGVTSRPGIEVQVAIPPEEQAEWGKGRAWLATGRGFGGGVLDERVVRGMVFARLADFVEGNAKTRPVVAERIAGLLAGPLPEVPLDGQAGAGEILPMMHVMKAVANDDFEEGEWMTLVNGSPASAALVCDVALHARNRIEHAEAVFALSIEAIRAPLEAYDEALEQLWGDEHEAASLRQLRRHLAGADPVDRLKQQAPVSYRILPRVLGQTRRAIVQLEDVARTSLRAAAHNPVFVPPDATHPHGRVFSTGGYHDAAASAAINQLNAAWADLALLAERHVTALHSAPVSALPNLLALPGVPGSETNLFGWVATGLVEEARSAAAPALLPACVNDARDDVSSPTFLAYGKQRRAAECLDGVIAILALSASQALFVGGRSPAPPLEDLLAGVRSVVAPVDGPRPDLGGEAGRLARVFDEGALSGRLDWRTSAVSA